MRTAILSLSLIVLLSPLVSAQPGLVLKAEADRVAAVAKVKPSVVAIFARGGQGGGTGVLIDEEGYALTNFHVVQPTGPTMQCGLPDGVLYDAVLVGLDMVGDVALIKLLPKKEGQKFPVSPIGDSDKVAEGDWSIAMGNPFLLATDFTPTVTFGLISGVHRYQPPAGAFLEYTDCIQIDTSINPGNSGGPLYNLKGELIGINGRGSFDKRARINSGVGYAISINQIKNFMGHLRAGINTDHASLGALVKTEAEKNGIAKTLITSILDEADAARRGLDQEDEVLMFAGRQISSDNNYKNILGIFPRGWRVPLEYRRLAFVDGAQKEVKKEILVRLMGQQRKALDDQPPDVKKDDPKQPPIKGKGPVGPGAKFYEPKAGYANYYFNRQEQNRLFTSLKKHSDLTASAGAWTVEGNARLLKANATSPFLAEIKESIAENKSENPTISLKIGAFTPYVLEPLKAANTPIEHRGPKGSGGMLAALYCWRHLLTQGAKGFPSECDHGGVEPIYPPLPDGSTPKVWSETRVDAEVLSTQLGIYKTKWFFSRDDQKLLGMEVNMKQFEDPCEVYFSDYRNVQGGGMMPHRIQVYYQDIHYGTFTVTSYKLAARGAN